MNVFTDKKFLAGMPRVQLNLGMGTGTEWIPSTDDGVQNGDPQSKCIASLLLLPFEAF